MSKGEDVPILVCVPVRALPSPEEGSVKSVCQACEQPVWVSVHGMAFLGKNPTIYIACNNCAIDIIGAENFQDGFMVPGSPEWMNSALEHLKEKVNLTDILQVRDLDDE